jgi:predicted nucleic-acid-binding protein
MKALDTNVLIRFLVSDDEKQARAVYESFKKAEAEKDVFFVPLLVVLESVWVLETVYEINRSDLLDAVNELLLMPILQFEAQTAIRKFLSSAYESNIDLPDLLIAHTAEAAGCSSVLTFDRKASKHELFELIR